MAEEALKILRRSRQYGVDVSLSEAHCGDILETDADTYVNSWFYCYSCKESIRWDFYAQELEMELSIMITMKKNGKW